MPAEDHDVNSSVDTIDSETSTIEITEMNEISVRNKDDHKVTYEDILKTIGPSGRWQYQLLALYIAFHVVATNAGSAYIYMLGVPPYYCEANYIKDSTFTNEMENATSQLNQCETSVLTNDVEANSSGITPCESWIFRSNQYYEQTAVSEWSLVCSHKAWASTIASIYVLGGFFGVILAAICGDTYGRRLTLLICAGIGTVSVIACSFVTNYTVFLALRFTNGFGYLGAAAALNVLVSENFTSRNRALSLGLSNTVHHLLAIACVGVIYLLRSNWRYYMMFQAGTVIVTMAFVVPYLPESPRWLIIFGRVEEAQNILIKAAKTNKNDIGNVEEFKEKIQDIYTNNRGSDLPNSPERSFTHNLLNWFKKIAKSVTIKEFRTRSMCVAFVFFASAMALRGTSYSTSKLSLGPYIPDIGSKVLTAIFYPVVFATINFRAGRRLVLIILSLLGAATIIASVFVPPVPSWIQFAFMFSGLVIVDFVANLIYFYTMELFPTNFRATAIGFGSLFSKTGTFLSTYIVDLLVEPYKFVPAIIFAAVITLAALVTLFLKETRDANLPETAEDLREVKKT